MTKHRTKLQFSLKALLGLVTFSAIICWAWPAWQEYRLVQSLRRDVLIAATSKQAGLAYKQLIERAKPTSLERLVNDCDVGIALKVSYELNRARDGMLSRLKPNGRERFLSLLRTHTGLVPPDWWVRSLSEKWSVDPDSLPTASIEVVNERVVISTEDKVVRMRRTAFEGLWRQKTDSPDIRCAAYIGHDRAYVAVFPTLSVSYPLTCVDAHSGEVTWKATVWAGGFDNYSGLYRIRIGGRVHCVQITVSGGLVAVWGAGIEGDCYVDVFNCETGANVFRFCTEFWFAD